LGRADADVRRRRTTLLPMNWSKHLMNYEQSKKVRNGLAAVVSEACAAVNAFPKGPDGWMTEDVKFSPECMAAKMRYVDAYQELQKFDQGFMKSFVKEIREERKARYAGANNV
jgi:hypothetical protein